MPLMSLLREDSHLQIESGAGETGTRLHVIGFDHPQIVLRLATHRRASDHSGSCWSLGGEPRPLTTRQTAQVQMPHRATTLVMQSNVN